MIYRQFIGIIRLNTHADKVLIKFKPNYVITTKAINGLVRIEATKEQISQLPLTPKVLNSLREIARLYTTHYSTMIEGNKLNLDQIKTVLEHEGHFPDRERDESEVKGYYAALTQVEKWAASKTPLTENMIQTLHALVMGNGKTRIYTNNLKNWEFDEKAPQNFCPERATIAGRQGASEDTNFEVRPQLSKTNSSGCLCIKPTKYRDGQNVIRDSRTKAIVYMPPEAKDVKNLMQSMVEWINKNKNLPYPVIASIAHYQFATIHPYYDGNGRVARLLTTFILHLGGYDLKGLYSLEEYYAKNLGSYYDAISIGTSHNYYLGRAEADITKWLEYFIEGMAISFENVLKRMKESKSEGATDQSTLIRKLDPRQRKVLQLFLKSDTITSAQIGKLFGFKPRTSSALCASWVKDGFLKVADPSNKGRKYKLAKRFSQNLKEFLKNSRN